MLHPPGALVSCRPSFAATLRAICDNEPIKNALNVRPSWQSTKHRSVHVTPRSRRMFCSNHKLFDTGIPFTHILALHCQPRNRIVPIAGPPRITLTTTTSRVPLLYPKSRVGLDPTQRYVYSDLMMAGHLRPTNGEVQGIWKGRLGNNPAHELRQPQKLVLKNRAGESKSPYVRAHSSNPVAWQTWGDEAIALAKKENRLLFVSIGYSACHCEFLSTLRVLDLI
jgi:hypothetical protein